jgi:probable addiction module antidote protein
MTKAYKNISSFPSYDDWVADSIGESAKRLNHYLDLVLNDFKEDGDVPVLLLGLGQVAKAKGGIAAIAQKTGLTREALYKILSKDGNPTITTLQAILNALGLSLAIQQKKKLRKS